MATTNWRNLGDALDNPHVLGARVIALLLPLTSGLATTLGGRECSPALPSVTPAAPVSLKAAIDQDASDQYPAIVIDPGGTAVAAWSSAYLPDAVITGHLRIVVARSSNGGLTWSDPSFIDPSMTEHLISHYSPQIAGDGNGHWIISWWSYLLVDGKEANDSDIFYSRSNDDGLTWSAAATLNSLATTDKYSDFSPTIATDGSGRWIVVWESANDDDLASTFVDRDLAYRVSVDNGESWSPQLYLNTTAMMDEKDDRDPKIVVAGPGTWLVVWWSSDSLGGTIGTEGDILFSRSADGGQTWSPTQPLNPDAARDPEQSDRTPSIASNNRGSWFCAWDRRLIAGPSTDSEVVCSASLDDGQSWSVPEYVLFETPADTGNDIVPRIVCDETSRLSVVWESTNNLGGTIGLDPDILAAQSDDGGATWSQPFAVNSTAAVDAGTKDLEPAAALTAGGKIVVLWRSDNSLSGSIGIDEDILWTTVSAADPPDCDDNGLNDACEIAQELSHDCNDNGMPDHCETAAGDLTFNGIVNGFDLAILLSAWGPCPSVGQCCADLNHNDVVNGFDLGTLLGNWG